MITSTNNSSSKKKKSTPKTIKPFMSRTHTATRSFASKFAFRFGTKKSGDLAFFPMVTHASAGRRKITHMFFTLAPGVQSSSIQAFIYLLKQESDTWEYLQECPLIQVTKNKRVKNRFQIEFDSSCVEEDKPWFRLDVKIDEVQDSIYYFGKVNGKGRLPRCEEYLTTLLGKGIVLDEYLTMTMIHEQFLTMTHNPDPLVPPREVNNCVQQPPPPPPPQGPLVPPPAIHAVNNMMTGSPNCYYHGPMCCHQQPSQHLSFVPLVHGFMGQSWPLPFSYGPSVCFAPPAMNSHVNQFMYTPSTSDNNFALMNSSNERQFANPTQDSDLFSLDSSSESSVSPSSQSTTPDVSECYSPTPSTTSAEDSIETVEENLLTSSETISSLDALFDETNETAEDSTNTEEIFTDLDTPTSGVSTLACDPFGFDELLRLPNMSDQPTGTKRKRCCLDEEDEEVNPSRTKYTRRIEEDILDYQFDFFGSEDCVVEFQ